MADNLDFTAARAATASMLPVGDEEGNALWMRKIAETAGRGIGAWGTAVATTRAADVATFVVDISSLGFNTLPSFDAYQVRGGTQPVSLSYDASPGNLNGYYFSFNGGTEFQLTMYNDGWSGNSYLYGTVGSWRAELGTFIYRFRGW